jgi:ADP-ribose pyrophosphatase
MRTRMEISAGGVIYRRRRGQPDVCLIATQGGQAWQLPKGLIERGEQPEEAARRELGEECGQRAGRLERLAGFYVSPGFCSEFVQVFLATELETVAPHPDADEELVVVRLPLAEALRRVEAGEIRDGKSIIGLTWAWAKVRGFTIE